MYNSTHSFYTSNEWRDVRQILIDERNNICECCGKRIKKESDRIGHHKIELDMTNINDPEITLNLDNLMLVCHKCHNAIHNRFGKKTRHRYLVYGPPLAGKKTWVNESATKEDLIISMDDIRLGITGGKLYENSNNTLDDVLAVRDFLIDRVESKASKARDVYIIGGYPYVGERESLCRRLDLVPIYIECDKEECLLRLENDTTRDSRLWTKYIDNWFDTYS